MNTDLDSNLNHIAFCIRELGLTATDSMLIPKGVVLYPLESEKEMIGIGGTVDDGYGEGYPFIVYSCSMNKEIYAGVNNSVIEDPDDGSRDASRGDYTNETFAEVVVRVYRDWLKDRTSVARNDMAEAQAALNACLDLTAASFIGRPVQA